MKFIVKSNVNRNGHLHSITLKFIIFGWHSDIAPFSFAMYGDSGYGVAEKCRFCLGSGNVTVELGGDEKEVSRCINCDGVGSLTCTTCQGSGIQPRYLDRRYRFRQMYIMYCLVLSVM